MNKKSNRLHNRLVRACVLFTVTLSVLFFWSSPPGATTSTTKCDLKKYVNKLSEEIFVIGDHNLTSNMVLHVVGKQLVVIDIDQVPMNGDKPYDAAVLGKWSCFDYLTKNQISVQGEPHYLVVTHAHRDHTGWQPGLDGQPLLMLGTMMEAIPGMKLILQQRSKGRTLNGALC